MDGDVCGHPRLPVSDWIVTDPNHLVRLWQICLRADLDITVEILIIRALEDGPVFVGTGAAVDVGRSEVDIIDVDLLGELLQKDNLLDEIGLLFLGRCPAHVVACGEEVSPADGESSAEGVDQLATIDID